MEQYYNSAAGLPEAMVSLPFCCWKAEMVGKRVTKVPYNPKSGRRAKVDSPETFGTMEEAVKAYENGQYAGIGVNISGHIGCIDVDHCVREGEVNDTAREILTALPDAFAEVSPSGTGLHLFFNVPDGFAFDRERYYINNRKYGVEIYIPDATNHFMTITGNVYRNGNLSVTEVQLASFLDKFMLRERNAGTTAVPPDGGSILSDAEVIRKLSSEHDGQRFMALYRGDWRDAVPDSYNGDWSQSEADMSLCSKLAFYCRADIEQMDRLFRSSGLMREKWDRGLGASTYGEVTLRNAAANCKAFYDPRGENDSVSAYSAAADDFTVIDHSAVIDCLLESDITAESLLSEDALAAAAWAYKNDALRYTKLRQAVPKEIGLRNYERAVKQRLSVLANENEHIHTDLLALSGRPTPGMLVPAGWEINDGGICYMGARVSVDPLYVSGKMENVDDGTEKLEITFRRNGRYRTIIAPRSDMLNKNSVIRYADEGLPVSSGNAALITGIIAALENANDRIIPLKRCVRRAGWIGDITTPDIEFFPYHINSPMLGQEDDENAERFLEHLRTSGSEDEWLRTANIVRTMPFARSLLAASFASVLLYPLQHRNIYYHAWCDSKSGKTAALKFAMSVWGDPQALVKSYFATMVGMERRAGTMKHLPLALDELQTRDKRVDVNNMVYTLGNGVGKTRGRAGGGIRTIDDWRNCILSTGETPLSSDNSMDGVNTRLLEVNACPVKDESTAAEIHRASERNFGFAGVKYINWLIENVFNTDKDTAFGEAVELGAALMGAQRQEDHTDTVDRAWYFVTGWVAANKSKFGNNNFAPVEVYGFADGDKVYVINNALNDALEKAGYSPRKCIKGFGNRGYIDISQDSQGKTRTQHQKRINGVNTRVYVLNINTTDSVPHDERAAFSDN